MADTKYSWPSREKASLLGQWHNRVDGLHKVTGHAKYTYDVNLKNQLIVKALDCPHAHCRIKSIDVEAARKVPGVVDVLILPHAEPGSEISWAGELLVAVAGETEGAANEGVGEIKIEYELLDVFTQDELLDAAQQAERTGSPRSSAETEIEPGDDDDEDEFVEKEIARLLKGAEYTAEGYYGVDVITHCCLETHGCTLAWEGDKLKVYLSTQNVSQTDDQIAQGLKNGPEKMEIGADNVDVICQYIGGGFGSKFAPDYWTIAAARIAKRSGRPVKFMLDRDQDQMIAGNRPSGYIRVRLGADKDGVVTVWDSHHWGTSGFSERNGRVTGGGVNVGTIPYVYAPPNHRSVLTPISTNLGPARAWRAPNNPQACLLTQSAFDDLAAKMGVDSYDIFWKNMDHIDSGQTADVYRQQMEIGAKLMDWKAKWHPHGKGPRQGSVVEGLGMAIHTWRTPGHASTCRMRINPDGTVQSYCGSQDLGTGTRTVCALVVAETFGLKLDEVQANIGMSTYPVSGPSGGSTTVGGVSESHRRAAQDALAQLFDIVAPKLSAKADALEAVKGRIQVKDNPSQGLSWREACSLLGLKPLDVTASFQGGETPLSGNGVGGLQMAHVAVDRETGVVKMKKLVAVQDMGLIVNRKTAESQVSGAVTMGIAYALCEQLVADPKTGAFLNAELRDYRLPRLGDIGEIVVEFFEPDDQRARGVIGLGEPPIISPGAAISNAVCNALGVRVGVLPLTPKRVLDALEQAAGRA